MTTAFAPCRACGVYRWSDGDHTCPPTWRWRVVGDGDAWSQRTVRAVDAEDAAKEAGELYDADCETYPLVSKDDQVEIEVSREGSDDVQRFEVTGYVVYKYRASEVDVE